MAYLELMILLSRFVFAGFAILFIVLIFSFMKPFISYSLGQPIYKHSLMFSCILFFHLGGTAILFGKAPSLAMRQGIIFNSVILAAAFIFIKWLLKRLKRQDEMVIWYIIFFLVDISYIMLERLNHAEATKQIVWFILGMCIAMFLPTIFGKMLQPKYKLLYMFLTLGMIILPFIFGESKYGAMNWVEIAGFGFQPSEFGKVTFVLFLAAHFDEFEFKSHKLSIIFQSIVFTGAILLMLVFQRDLGGALLYGLTFLIMLYIGTKNAFLPLIGIAGGAVAAILAYFCFGHVRVRVEAWIDPWADIAGNGYQVVQGLFAIGTWGWFGSGLTRGIPNKIPIVTTDYIFAALCEELGNIVGIVVLLAILGLILQGLKGALIQLHDFEKFLCIGFVVIIGLQTLIIVGGVLKLIPLTGITLPFVSYGGTSLFVCLGMMGIVTYFVRKTLKFARKEGKEIEE
ncbi:FtsW/RodA/SpoVE family cell cycle protein [Niameybacter massiliensis]|uniref:FtsW/RodA/SpoVE family cell cycle protein n=1 Tax=Holtiella tumoricola TaxID=3018743 RepID=A0AA42DNC0_9FIRM|nr:FtsW/RodA/SpoVE family cell cycle protein [Holtiella tumoricola]MDA3732427.1 FtsW/RodA/SpoVE family cell cycle protein [Holtiella tumoricola]